MSKTISILGSTGSIGRQTLDVAQQLHLRVAAITAHASVVERSLVGGNIPTRLSRLENSDDAKSAATNGP